MPVARSARSSVISLRIAPAAVLTAGDGLPPAARPEQWAGQPGTRAPHVWLTCDGERLSTLDLFQRGWVLLTGNDHWIAAAERTGIAVDCRRIGEDVLRAFGLSQDGATLVRPDGYIAWRSPGLPAEPAHTLRTALGRVSFAP